MKIKAVRVKTKYWRLGTDYIKQIVDSTLNLVQDGDLVTVSEKAVSVALGLVVDESKVNAGRLAKFLSSFWTRRIWGGPLGKVTKLRSYTLMRLRNFPLVEGAAHKQTALRHSGLLQSLRHYSEGGIDASNLPYSLVSLPLRGAQEIAEKIREAFHAEGRNISAMLVDGDTTYSWRNLHLSPRKVQVPHLVHFGGFLTFVIGRIFGFKSRSTPIAISGESFNPDFALTLANIAHRVRGYGAGRTVWDMSEKLGTKITEVTWDMLDRVPHYPIVILRRI